MYKLFMLQLPRPVFDSLLLAMQQLVSELTATRVLISLSTLAY